MTQRIPIPLAFLGSLRSLVGIAVLGTSFLVLGLRPVFSQGWTPPTQNNFVCGTVSVGTQCGAESQTVNCAAAGGYCSFCRAPNPNALVTRCLEDPGATCVNLIGDPEQQATVQCGTREYGECDGQGNCVRIGSTGATCSNIKPNGCQLP